MLLVAVDDKGHVPAGSDAFVKVALTGALLAELAIDGQLTVGDDGTVRTADPRPADVLARATSTTPCATTWKARRPGRSSSASAVTSGKPGSRGRPAGRRWRAGPGPPSVLRPTRHPVLDTAARQAVLDQVRAAARGEGPVRPDVGVVLALAGPCRLRERVAPDRGTRGEAKKQIARGAVRAQRRHDHRRAIAAVAVTAATAAF